MCPLSAQELLGPIVHLENKNEPDPNIPSDVRKFTHLHTQGSTKQVALPFKSFDHRPSGG
eukprot:1158208-Pelagomonas_calceolata.AAC.3